MSPRLLVIGLDCAPPQLVFDRYRRFMPFTETLIARGLSGTLESTQPPITVPAWTSLFSGREPGELGVYGFHCREQNSYESRLVSSDDVRSAVRVWDLLEARGYSTARLFIPPSWPVQTERGIEVSCLLTPRAMTGWAFPPSLEGELEDRFGAYEADIPEFRHEERDQVVRSLYSMGRQHFAIARHLVETRRPDFLAMVEIGPDRLHHLFWNRMDPQHPRYDATRGDPGAEYYAFLDAQIAELCAAAGPDTHVMLVSDHGAQAMHGGFHLNEWLCREGYLAMRENAGGAWRLDDVDWTHTRAWGEGGYVGRVHLNVEGREPGGIVPVAKALALRHEIAARLKAIPGPSGQRLLTRALAPEDIYRVTRGPAPDLQVFVDDLRYRCFASRTSGSLFSPENDRGADSCNHAMDGVFVFAGPQVPPRTEPVSASIYDIAPTILGLFNVRAPSGVSGRDWSRR